jgi:Uma2 family endonuclease
MATEVFREEAGETLTRRPATIEEFWSLPESVLPVEYVNGEIIMAPTPTPLHQITIANVFRALDGHVMKNRLGKLALSPLDVVLPTGEVVQPDIFLLTAEQWGRALNKERVSDVPSFAVEILSPGTAAHDRVTKRAIYEKNGVREYWIVDAKKRSIAQLVLRKKRYVVKELGAEDVLKSAVLEGFEMRVGELLGLD